MATAPTGATRMPARPVAATGAVTATAAMTAITITVTAAVPTAVVPAIPTTAIVMMTRSYTATRAGARSAASARIGAGHASR